MAERTVDINLDWTATASNKITNEDRVNTGNDPISADMLPEVAPETRAEKRARLIQIYERGVVGDRLHVDLPPDKVGQWVVNDTMAIHRMEGIGYQVDREFAPKRKLHDKGDGASYVGDVVYMVADRETREIIDEIKAERYERLNNPRRQKEETDFEAANRVANSSAGIGTLNESKAHIAKKSEIEKALEK